MGRSGVPKASEGVGGGTGKKSGNQNDLSHFFEILSACFMQYGSRNKLNGRKIIKVSDVLKLACALGVGVGELFETEKGGTK